MYFVYDVSKPQFGRTVTTVTEAVAVAEAQSSGAQYKVRAGDVNGHEIGSAFHGSWHGVKPTN